MKIYPLSLKLHGRLAVVVGGGAVAVRRVGALRDAGADVLVVAPDLSPTLADLADRGHITARHRRFEPADLDPAWLALACTDDPAVNAHIALEADHRKIWCIRADDAAASTAWIPAVGRTTDVTIAVNANRNPRRAAALRDHFVESLPTQPTATPAIDGTGAPAGTDAPATPGTTPATATPGAPGTPGARVGGGGGGTVAVVGGGPGDPGLLTVRGRDLLRAADVVVTDRLAPLGVLEEVAPDAEVVDAAKVPGGAAMRQDRINEVLVARARAGRRVVRLKGGDPYVFGRGMEEVTACTVAGVPVEVVPGVTSAVAVPASAGIPVTHRGRAQGFTVVSGHVPPDDPRSTVDWAALARAGTTLVLLMAVENLEPIVDRLRAYGMPADVPAACVVDGCTPQQRVVGAPLGGLVGAARAAGVVNPAVVVIGDVARFATGDVPYAPPSARVLVLGGSRSGKSVTAERMLAGHDHVEYVATGSPPGDDDPEWADRVRRHRDRRPATWTTTETLDLPAVLTDDGAPVPALVDCLSTWLTSTMDECGVWTSTPGADAALAARVDALLTAWRKCTRHVVVVSSEVGSGVVPATAAGRRFRDELGDLNARLAAESDEVWLCTAGVPQRLR